MDVVILKVACKNLSNFEKGLFSVDFITEKRVFPHEKEGNTVEELFGSICKLNTLAFAGINATGKTTVLNILSTLLQTFIGNSSLNYDMKITDYFEDALEVETYYYKKSTRSVYKLSSLIKKDDASRSLVFTDETLYCKKATAPMSKADLFCFEKKDIFVERLSVKDTFLKKEDSIFSKVMNPYDESVKSVIDMCGTTNHNILSSVSLELMIPFVQYLDPSIEYIKVKDVAKGAIPRVMFDIKFKKSKKPFVAEIGDLDTYLSSGTIKGISCLSNIAFAFELGGYVLIDEIENHLNKTIVVNIINLFTSEINRNCATLLFTTHYSEILDSLDRSDGIYLLSKTDLIKLTKFSVAADEKDRKDKKRSDLILSGVLDSAPSYRAYQRLVDSLRKNIWKEDLR